jgi:hypothetical protein
MHLTGPTARRDNPRSGEQRHTGYVCVGKLRVNTVAECTVPEKILMAAHELEQQGQSPFSAEALIVTAWQKFPRTFGLKGYGDQHPDSNKILSCIMGNRGLARRGWLAKMGQKLYTLTREGRQVVLRLQEGGGHTPLTAPAPTPASRLSRDQEKMLLGLQSSTAVHKFEEGLKNELTFGDACRFWGISENLHGEALDQKLEKLRLMLLDIERVIGQTAVELSTGRSVAREDVSLLMAVHEWLTDRFSRHLSLLRNRNGRS